MSIILLQEQREYLLYLLEKKPEWWVRDKLIEEIKSDVLRTEKMQSCEHVFGKYTGHKECCSKCGCLDIGMGEDWSLENTPTGV